MGWYRKRPVIVCAEQWWPGVPTEGVCQAQDAAATASGQPHVHTLEGVHLVSPGDWIVTGVHGEQYPVKPAIFAATYEETDGPAAP